MEYEHAEHVAASPEQLFGVLAKAENLAHFVPQLTAVRRLDGEKIEVEARYGGHTHTGEAWLRSDSGSRRVEWGVEGHQYHGSFDVEPDGDGSRLRLKLTTGEGRSVDEHDVEATLDAVRMLLEAEV
jgi:carbon monoxide dehydrogenase subunit G